ncbi:DUF721 domain-containing protein [Litorilituus lipolyticus]|uniref:DUF721 domain-containing protein n=1 Tax=Litorilituus lipolyticus TaxID=2491017 RepID=A0A502KKG3_9GAMM|nr:DciA family protein [Litorilituus lipolyticus]TPH12042.1 DUF721 domain-containing protein [Litorilituus lipolyticus]
MARKPKKPLNLSTLLQSTTGTLAQIQSKTNSLTILADIVRQICPDLPEEVWHIANFRQDTLIIELKTPVWGQRLQFERNKICQQLAIETEGQCSKIEIKVNPQGFISSKSDKTLKQKQKISAISPNSTSASPSNPATARLLLDVAQSAPKGLKEKLEKLANVAGKK